MKRLTCLLFIVFFTKIIFAQNYLWPTSASQYLSASFCEYRPGHYHSAIDIKTWNQEGYPVFAVDDGRIYRVRVSPFGYGKVLYLKLKDGRFAVYAHLQRFNPKLEQAVRKVQLKKQRYTIDWQPENWPVKKGEIMAYTGQTGIGVPHLHFEIRDPQNHVLNPLHFFKNRIKDTIPPTLLELLFIPLNPYSSVNGSVLPAVIPLKKQDGMYRLTLPVYAKGQIGLAIRGFDRANDVYNKYGFYRETLFLNEKPIFWSSYDTLDFSKTRQIDVEIYYPLKILRKKRFQKLFKEPFNILDFSHTDQCNGVLTVGKKPRNFRIVVSDFWENRSTVQGTILPGLDSRPQIVLARQMQNQLFVKLLAPVHLKTLTLLHSADGLRWQKIKTYEIVQPEFRARAQQMLLRATLNPGQIKKLKIDGTTTDGQPFSLVHDFFLPKDSLSVQIINLGKYWVIHYAPLQNLNDRTIQTFLNDQPIRPITRKSAGFLEQVIRPTAATYQSLKILVKDFEQTLFDSTIHFSVLFPGRSQKLSLFNDSLQISADRQALYDTLIFVAKKESSVLRLQDSLPLFSPGFQFDWYPQALRKPINIALKYNPSSIPDRTLGCYRLDADYRLGFLGGAIDSVKRMVTLRTKGMPDLLVAGDTIPPLVKVLNLREGQTVGRLKFVKISVDDSLSGLDSDLNFRIFMDEQWLIPEWDPERKQVLVFPHWQLKNGTHHLQIEVKDRAGNLTKKSLTFFLKGNQNDSNRR